MKVELVDFTLEPIDKIETAAKNCYDTQKWKQGKMADGCYKSGHLAVFEFATFHFKIWCSRACSHQLVRHRVASFAQRSQRYCVEDNFKAITPPSLKKEDNQKALILYEGVLDIIQDAYLTLVQDYGIKAEDARYLLPNACETVIDMQMNMRELMHFMNLRLCNRAQWEIRQIAQEMKKLVVEKVDKNLEKYLVPNCEKYIDKYGIAFCPEEYGCKKYPTLTEIIEKGVNINEQNL